MRRTLAWFGLLVILVNSSCSSKPDESAATVVEGQGGSPTGASGGTGNGGEEPVGEPLWFWYGSEQTFGSPGAVGAPQNFVNVLGRVGIEVSDAVYRINDGSQQPLALGPDDERLEDGGDFNIEIDRTELEAYPSKNTVEVELTATSGETVVGSVSVFVHPESSASPFEGVSIDFGALTAAGAVNEVAQIVDGFWELDDDGLYVDKGYDRNLAVGHRGWPADYEVVATVTIHSWRAFGGVGLGVGWQGHAGATTPRTEWPLTALGWIRNEDDPAELQLMTFEGGDEAITPFSIDEGGSYGLRLRTESSGDTADVSLRIWSLESDEPNAWMLQESLPARAGSVLLVAHDSEVTWHSISVEAF